MKAPIVLAGKPRSVFSTPGNGTDDVTLLVGLTFGVKSCVRRMFVETDASAEAVAASV